MRKGEKGKRFMIDEGSGGVGSSEVPGMCEDSGEKPSRIRVCSQLPD